MRRIVLWFTSTATVVTLLFGYHTSTSAESATGGTTVVSAPAGQSSTATSGSAADEEPTSSSTVTVTGPAVDTRWGPVQVQATVADGTITDVTVVEYPTGNGKDRQINAYAIPRLVQATLDAQSADIDMVSGATVTSEGYVESLQSALDQAGR
ncbi:FMN-binding protein [Geodermatophilus sp. TF02-6]|uniref:FMN-binding protein n=1 Tax=Geodermatophilus sp. TF02-6 TaxID=2250575 RepID=UPI000DEBAEC1|nr:FMN-binding protein [Geodermatophilus sp. TF02-6]RBY83710.1 FMN-binding protein [Geodermatophilus sp. TF02-6]